MLVYKKFDQYDGSKAYLENEIRNFLKVDFEDLEIYHIYYFKHDRDKDRIAKEIFDFRTGALVENFSKDILSVEVLDHRGQYNQIEDQTNRFIKNILNIDNEIIYSLGYRLTKIDEDDLEKIKTYLINDVVEEEFIEANFDYGRSDLREEEAIEGFNSLDEKGLEKMSKNLAMDLDDLMFLQDYFIAEGREPNYIEVKMIDTYWSDHCRHTTFSTNLKDIKIEEGANSDLIEDTFKTYKKVREEVYGSKKKPISLMDLATINMKKLVKENKLTNIEKSSEVNACSVEIDIEVDGRRERWLHMFKNETHNHPTEIEPYGGAHTCMGGAIRDPLSGRAKVFQSMRISGSGNPLEAYEDRMENKLAQRLICQDALAGFSDYANQIGIPAGYAREYYDDGFKAKRMELGALVAASKKSDVTRLEPKPGDLIILLGARTGRDGLGAAVGSSSVQTKESLKKVGAEVQRGNPYEERKIMRLFDNPQAKKMIKKSNDFGAGGVSVAIGELADGLEINLDKVFLKYEGLNGYEIALSESQERMAVVIDPRDKDAFIELAEDENLLWSLVATVNDSNRLIMKHKGREIVNIKRDFLDSNGAKKFTDVLVKEVDTIDFEEIDRAYSYDPRSNLSKNFDSTNGSNTVLMEYGGRKKETRQLGMAAKFPVRNTDAVSLMCHGYFPEISRKSPFMAAYLAVYDAVTRTVAMGSKLDDIRLSLQEYFPTTKNDPERFGTVFSAMLGAFRAMDELDLAAIGGKDSMSGSFNDIDVPPSLVAFAVSHTRMDSLVSREFKSKDSLVYMTNLRLDGQLVEKDSYKETIKAYENLLEEGIVKAASTVKKEGLEETFKEMARGNEIGYKIYENWDHAYCPGMIIFEIDRKDRDKLSSDFILIGETLDLNLDSIYKEDEDSTYEYKFVQRNLEKIKLVNKKVLIPILEGTVGEEDLANRFLDQGFKVEEFVIKTNSHKDYLKSLSELERKISETDVLALAHGEYYGAAIKNVSGALTKVLSEDRVYQAIENLLARKGFVFGLGAGFSSLIDLGLFGPIEDQLYFVENTNKAYRSDFIDGLVLEESYFTDEANRYYSAPISGKNIRLVAKDWEKLEEHVNIISIKTKGNLEESSIIDSISSKNQQVFGSHSLIDRMGEGLYKNIDIKGQPRHFNIFMNKIK